MHDRITDFSSPLHDDDSASDLGRVSVPATSKVGTRAVREAAHAMVAEWWLDAIEGQRTKVAAAIGVTPRALGRYADGSLRLALADVVLSPSPVASQVLHVALDHVSGQHGNSADPVDDILFMVCQALELARRLKASPVETIPDSLLDGLISLGREALSKLGSAVHDLVREREERRKKAGGR